ncbi:MAG: thioesterase family protein [Myxococcota bacterium]
MRIDASFREQWEPTEDGWQFVLPDGWMQGRSMFGGLTAAAAVALGARSVDEARSLRVASVQLLRPVKAGVLGGTAKVLREGKGTTFVEVRLRQSSDVVALVQLVFVRPRTGSVALEDAAPPDVPGPEGLADLPYLPGITPEFTQHARLRWARGPLPFSGADEAGFDGWCRFRGPAGDAEGLIAMLDLWPTPTLALANGPTFASTVTWTAHIVGAPNAWRQGEGWAQFRYRSVAARAGFHTVVGELWGSDGALLAWTEQLVAFFD